MPGEIPVLVQPRSHKASVVLWSDLNVTDMDRLENAVTTDQVKGVLSDLFQLSDYQENHKSAILLDMFNYTIQFARDKKFTKEQTSAFFSIVKKTHEVNVETPFGNVDHCFRYFRELVLCHAVKRPPFSVQVFSVEEVQLITEYVVNSYFRHYKLYKYVYTPQVRLDLSITYEGMPTTPPASEAGEDTDNVLIEDETGEAEAGSVPPEDAEKSQEPQEENKAASELRILVQQQLAEEVEKIKLDLDNQLKQSEDTINEKLVAIEGSTGGKQGSARGRKK